MTGKVNGSYRGSEEEQEDMEKAAMLMDQLSERLRWAGKHALAGDYERTLKEIVYVYGNLGLVLYGAEQYTPSKNEVN